MKNIQEYSKSKVIRYFIAFVIFISWLFPYTNQHDYLFYENVGLILISVIAFLCLVLFEDTHFILEILLFVPFMFSHTMSLMTIPLTLYITIGIVIIGFILHILIYKQKLKFPKLFVGLSFIAISLVLGGLLYDFEGKAMKMLLLAGLSIAFLIFYCFLTSTTKSNFDDLTSLITIFGFYIIGQVAVYAICNTEAFLVTKQINTGWAANSNNIAMMLLMAFPFTYYDATKNKGIKALILYLVSFVELLTIIITFSRGAMFAAAVAFTIFAIVLMIMKTTRKKAIIFASLSFVGLVLICTLIYFKDKNLFDTIIYHITKINLENLNGRVPIYEEAFSKIKEQLFFGYSVFDLYRDDPKLPAGYLWMHNTFLQAAYTLGLTGLIAMIYHFIEKYLLCFKNINLQKIVLLFAFFASDIYGFFDVNYFFINFMILLMVILIMSDSLFVMSDSLFKRKTLKFEGKKE